MRVLIVHCRYRRRGGEDVAVDAEIALLQQQGVTVLPYIADNAAIAGEGSLGAAVRAIWSASAYKDMQQAIAESRPDIVHIHNTFAALSPSVVAAAHATGVPVVQSLHNFRLFCPNGLLLRDLETCELCLHRTVKWPGILHRCYRNSAPATAAVAAMLAVHHWRGTWKRDVDLFVVPSPTTRNLFIAGGLPADRVVVKPNVVHDPGAEAASWDRPRSGAVAIGRLDREKGLEGLVRLWSDLDMDLTIIGDGPLRAALTAAAGPRVRFVGTKSSAEVSQALAAAEILLLPTLTRETFAMVVIEAMAHGVPVLASDLGACRDWVIPGRTGFLLPPADAAAWRAAIDHWRAMPRTQQMQMGHDARTQYRIAHGPEQVAALQIGYYEKLLR